jgi:nucleotide-binding universal stress UspA family protein
MNWKTLLVPHDFSPSADRALVEAAALARHHGARLVLIHITQLPPGFNASSLISDPNAEPGAEMIRVDAYARNNATAKLDALANPLRADGVAVEARASIGEIDEEILAAAKDCGADLIVMGTHGRTGLAHLFLGSMTEKVLRHATIPVLTVRIATE